MSPSGQSGSGLAATYAQKSNDELVRLAADKGSLTEEAQQALNAELGKRGIAGNDAIRSAPPQAAPPAEVQPFQPLTIKVKNALMVLGLFAAMIGGFVLVRFATDSSSSLGAAKWPLAFLGLALFVFARWWFSRN